MKRLYIAIAALFAGAVAIEVVVNLFKTLLMVATLGGLVYALGLLTGKVKYNGWADELLARFNSRS